MAGHKQSLCEYGDLDRLARELGQHDPNATQARRAIWRPFSALADAASP
jgi:hypothetical protein